MVLEEGLENRIERHRRNSRALSAGLEVLGFKLFAQEGHRLPMLNAVWIPEGVDDAAVRQRLLKEFNIEIGAGLAKFAGKIWRIGLMGASSRKEHVIFFLAALETSRWKIKGEGNAASRLGLKPSSLRSRMKRLGIERPN